MDVEHLYWEYFNYRNSKYSWWSEMYCQKCTALKLHKDVGGEPVKQNQNDICAFPSVGAVHL